ncbi:hypothetical protein sphantq_02940 [Sphingobium sp. AntQ-1]|nr:hypothetical protein sphantq_02940 [Sphingobium sp. AntQ-1]
MAADALASEKTCTKCNTTKPATTEHFYRQSGGSLGLNARCRMCLVEAKRELRSKPKATGSFVCEDCRVVARKASNRQKVCAPCRKIRQDRISRARKARIKGKEASRLRQYRIENIDYIRSRDSAYRQRVRENETPEQREARKQRQRKAVAKNRTLNPLRHRLQCAMRRRLQSKLSRGSAKEDWATALGYSWAELKIHLERQFLPKMSWENIHLWHIDHIVPDSSFSYESIHDEDFKLCWALSNLRPLWATENIRKQAKRLYLI